MEGTTSKNAKLLATAGFLFITMIWGGSFVVMKNSVDLVPPSYLLALRFTPVSYTHLHHPHRAVCGSDPYDHRRAADL